MRVGFHGDLKCLALRERLKNPLAECYVSRIWSACYLQEVDRVPADVGPAFLERSAEWKGKTGGLVTALLETGFLDRDGDNLIVHGVAKRLSKMRVFREKAAERKDRWEKKHAGERAAEDVPERPKNAFGTGPERVPNDVQDRQDQQDRPTEDHDTTGAGGAFDGPRTKEPTTAERLRCAVSQSLGIVGAGGGGLSLGDGRKLGQVIRDANAAVKRNGFESVVEALVSDGQQAKANGRHPETLTFFARTLAGLANPEEPRPTPARVTAAASPAAKFEKGGPVAI